LHGSHRRIFHILLRKTIELKVEEAEDVDLPCILNPCPWDFVSGLLNRTDNNVFIGILTTEPPL
jgi:hypothetical protein